MDKRQEGENFIFLISQPRAGSTMSQRILGSHPNIYTVSEPWILLGPLYPLHFDNFNTEYKTRLFIMAWQNFFQQLPKGEEAYYQGLRLMYSYLYNCVLKDTGKKFFLDKTPRYYYIISEIYRTFPKAKFIILLRNPLAVLCSIINTWVKAKWSKMEVYKYDLIKGPSLLLEGIKNLGDRCLVLHYEKIILNPEKEFQRICQTMGLKFFPEMIEYGINNSTKWQFGDQELVYQKTRPEPQNLDKWILSLENPQIWQAANDYLEFLGLEIVYQMGYSYRQLRKTLDVNRPKEVDWAKISSVEWLKRKPEHDQETPQTSLGYAVMAKKNQRQGKLVEATAAYRKALELNPNSAWSYFHLGETLSKLQKWDEAIAAYQQAIKLNPNSGSFHYNLAEAFMQKGSLDEAIAHYSKTIAIKPSFSVAHNSLGEALAKQGKLVEDVDCFPMKRHFISYGDENFKFSRERIDWEANNFGVFDSIKVFRPDDLSPSFKEKFAEAFKHERGGGYWVWKPYIIYEKLSQINHGDVLVYLDAGCHINSGGLQRYNDYEQIVLNSETGMLAVQTEHLEKHYTNSKVLEYFKVDNNQDILNSGIIQATIIIIHKKKQSQSIIKAWLDVVVEDYRLFTDDYNEYKKKEYFIDHRHDQSSFSILMKLKKGETIPDETWVSSNWESIHDIPFQARRLEQKMKTESEKILQAVLLNQEDWLRAWQIALKAKVDGDIKLVDKACNIVLKVRPQFWFARELPMHARGFYSQMDQDKLIEWYFQECPPQNKVFLEIGAFDGVHYSNVRRLHEKHGWTGISVEPVQKNFNKLARSYENTSVQCVRAAVGTESGEIEINVSTYPHLPEWGSDVATLRESEMSRWKQYGAIWNQEKVALKTLTSIINESHFDDIDFLSIDTEGYDLEVLKSLDWGRFNPSLIIVEYGKQRDEILNFLTGLEYSLLLDNKQDLFLANVKRSCESRKPQKDSLVDQSAIGEDIINRLKELKELATNSTVSHPKHSKIVGLIAARNEQVFIKTCLLGLARYTDAIVYLDDASDDDTLRIVESLAQECRIEKIIRKQKWHRDEPGDRNAMLLAGREIGGTHFISLDADELFTSNCLDNNFLREQIFKLQPGDKILLNWIQLWRGINQYRFDDSVWTWNYKGFIFCDDGKCSYSSAFIHTPRIPKNLSGNSKRIEGYDYGVMHFQFVNWRNLLVKQSWYRCLERIRDPQKPVTEINRLYAPSKDETNLGVSDSPYKWFSGYEFFDPSIYNLLEQWREKQILQWFAEYSWEYFAELDVWDIDWGKGDDNFQSIVLNKSTITMSTLGKMGRFGNQIFEYAFLKIYAEQHNLNVETPSWIGQYLFGHKDPPISQQLPKFKERIDRVELSLSRVLNSPTPLKNVDLWGYFQYHTSYYAQHKNYFCSLFQPVLSIEKKVRKGWEKLQAQGKTIIGIHLRRTDAGSGPYYITPSDRYKEWLAEFWETLNEPVLFIASDELDAVINDFQEYEPITVKDLDIELPKSDFYPDFYILSCCDIVAISNSSFSFAACMLNNQAKLFFRPSLVSHKLIPFDPWDSDVLLHEKKLKLPDKGYKAQITTKDFLSVFVGDTMKIVAKVKNISSVPWQASYISHIFLSGYWLDGKINLAKLSEFQARFHKEIKPGEATEVSFKIDAPSLPGQFVLELDLLDEDITWFKDKGSETFRVQVSVAKNTGSLTNAALYKVSAIVSTYNSEKFIRGCLQDLVEQTLYQKGELEIVIIDNTSEQNERGIVEEFQSKYSHIVYHRTPQRETLYASWNRGIKTSRGEYITNANTDDRHRLDALEIMANYLDANSEASVVYADQLITYTPNETWSTTKATKKFNWPEFSYSELQKRYIIGPQIMWRKSLHEKYGYFRDRYKSSGDYEFWLRVGRTENLVRLPETLGIYYWKPEGLSTAPESARSV